MNELPNGWIKTSLGSFTYDCNQHIPAETDVFKYIDIGSLNRTTKRIEDPQVLTGKEAPSRARKLVRTGDVLVSMTRPNLNAVALVPDDLDSQIASTGFDVLRVHEVDPRWVFNLVRTVEFVDTMSELVQGALYPAVRSKDIRGYDAPLAPLNEQKRIADKLDAVLARVDTCRDRLDRIPAILKRFRQSVLSTAISGKLTEEWRSETNAAEWQQSDVQSVAQVGTGSTPLRSNPSFFSSSGTPWITSSATSLTLVTSAEEFVTQSAITAHRLKTYPIGTLLVAMYGEGKTRGQVTELGISATINQACAAVVVNEEIALKNYVKLALQANYFEMREMAEGGNQPNLNLTKIKEFPLPLPSTKEQAEIVRRVESLFAYADRLEANYNTARAQIEKLTPALLAKAFRGELVPQDPNDEPASELLARIVAAKSEAQPKKRTGRQRKSQQQAETIVDETINVA
jgi:type I restriction enzyme S subunit